MMQETRAMVKENSLERKLLVNAPPEVGKDPTPGEMKRWSGLLDVGDVAILAAVVVAQPDYFITRDRHSIENPDIIDSVSNQILTLGIG